jgi:hypothetical protein
MPIEPLNQQQSWVRGKRAFSPLTQLCCWVSGSIGILSRLNLTFRQGLASLVPFPLPQLSYDFGIFMFEIFTIFGIWYFHVRDYFVWEKFVAPTMAPGPITIIAIEKT